MKSKYSKTEIQRILAENKFEYHRVRLPYGLSTPGEDRSSTFSRIFADSLDSKSVLDIGCANGYFCFEAEALGATRVVGVELMDNRYKHALLLKEILESNVEFIQQDILNETLAEKFDYVLLLNVIHHLKEPMLGLRKLASITKEKLVIEFPTFKDPKFRKYSKIRFPFIYNKLPLIGVSSLQNRHVDQTFVFSPKAITNILLDHEKLFTSVEFFDSPMSSGRQIAICRK